MFGTEMRLIYFIKEMVDSKTRPFLDQFTLQRQKNANVDCPNFPSIYVYKPKDNIRAVSAITNLKIR